MLAWIRTSIGLMAFGFVVARFGASVGFMDPVTPEGPPLFPWIGAALILLGGVVDVLAARRFVRVRRAMLTGTPMQVSGDLGPILAVVLSLAAIGLAVSLMVR